METILCECGFTLGKHHISRHKKTKKHQLNLPSDWVEPIKKTQREKRKEYYKTNKEHLNNKTKEYYENNKEQLILKSKEVVKCECGVELTHGHILRHKKTKKHLDFLKNHLNINL